MGGWVGDRLEDVGQSISGAVKDVERAVIRPIGGPIEKAGSQLDDFVNREIPGGWLTVGALGAGGYGLMNAGAGAGAAGAAGSAAGAAAVPSAFDAAVTSALGSELGLGSFGAIGTGGFAGAIPTATQTAAALTAAGFAPGTAANLAGLTQAGVGGISSAVAGLSASELLRAANVVKGLMGGQQPTAQPGSPGTYAPQGNVDYSGLYSLLSAKPQAPSLLGTRFMPENSSIAEYMRAEKIKNLLG